MTIAEMCQDIFMVAFLSVWFTGWTLGGTLAVHAFLGHTRQTAVPVVWFLITVAFAYNIFNFGSNHVTVIVWFFAWLFVSGFVTIMKFHFKSVKCAHDAIIEFLTHWSHRVDACVLRMRYAISIWKQPQIETDTVPLTMIAVSVHLLSGEQVLSDANVLSHDHVLTLRNLVERQLGLQDCAASSRLIFMDAQLNDFDRLCSAGVEDGSELTALIIEEHLEKEPEPQDVLPKQRPTKAAQCFLSVWLCGWAFGEVSVACLIQRTLLGLPLPWASCDQVIFTLGVQLIWTIAMPSCDRAIISII